MYPGCGGGPCTPPGTPCTTLPWVHHTVLVLFPLHGHAAASSSTSGKTPPVKDCLILCSLDWCSGLTLPKVVSLPRGFFPVAEERAWSRREGVWIAKGQSGLYSGLEWILTEKAGIGDPGMTRARRHQE